MKLGVIGGSGVYDIDGLEKAEWRTSGHGAHKRPKKTEPVDGEEMPVG